jgi:hypothetical protein
MSVYKSGLKGLVTESNPQDTPMDTMKDCSDVVVARDGTVESRHGLDTRSAIRTSGTWTSEFDIGRSLLSVYKIQFDSSVSGNTLKYVVLNRWTGEIVEMSSPLDFQQSLTVNKNVFETTGMSTNPIAFPFKESLFIMTGNGLNEVKKDVLSSTTAIQKLVQFPPFSDIQIDTFQDTFDLSANWLEIGKKVGIKLTYIWNNTYSDDTPREIESSPSQNYEVLHPMALRTQSAGSTISNTLVDKSRIRVRIGTEFNPSYVPFTNYVTNNNNGRKFFLRVYRTKQVNINEALPTEYYQAFPDMELGATTSVNVLSSNVDTSTDLINFTTDGSYWKNGDVLRYFGGTLTDIGGLVAGTVDDSDIYYIGNKTSTSFQIYPNSLLGTTGAINLISTGSGTQRFIRVYEANLTVNDDAIATLSQLYTNPNQDGDVNANAVPPIAKSIVQYKNYSVAANIREPLRAYISLVKQPLVKNVVGTNTIPNGTGNGVYTFSQFQTTGGSSDFYGLTSGEFGIDSPFFRIYPPKSVNFSGANATVSGSSDLPINITNGPINTLTSTFFFDANFVQTSAQITFRFDSLTTLTANVEPKYNRTSPYTRYTSLGGIGALSNLYPNAVAYDKNLEFLQFAGTLTKVGYGTLPFYSTGIGSTGQTYLDLANAFSTEVSTPDIFKSNTRGNKLASIVATSFTITPTYDISGTDFTCNFSKFDVAELPEPGILFVKTSSGMIYVTYKTFTTTGTTSIKFQNTTNSLNLTAVTGAQFFYAYVQDASNIQNTAFYFKNSPIQNRDYVSWNRGVSTSLTIEAYPVALTGYYDKPIGTANSLTSTVVDPVTAIPQNFLTNPLFLGNLARSPGQLLDECAADIVDKLNEQAAIAGIDVKFVKTDNVGEFYVESYPGASLMEARITGDYHTYEPAIIKSSSEWTTLAKFNKNNVRAVSISRYNLPEAYPNSSVLAPILVGKDDKEIVALARNTNDCYIIKEDGIWRLTINGNSSVAQVDTVINIDTTTSCQSPNSVQTINEEIIFLATDGFTNIRGNSLDNIGRSIETEVTSKLQRTLNNGLENEIRSWVNEEKRIYGCTIRDTSTTYTTYVLNTYTRQWTKFALPVIDATTDEQGRTFYAIASPTLTLSGTGTLQAQLQSVIPGTTSQFYITEETHTSGLYRNESDQWDYRHIASSVALGSGTQVVITDNTSTTISSWGKLGGSTTDITKSGLQFFVGRSAYYQKSGVLYPCTFVSRTATTCTVEFTTVPANITTLGTGDGLYAGVPASITLNPTNLGEPDTNKVFNEFQIHTQEAVSSLSMQFLTDSRADYSNPRVFAFNTSAPNRTVYRTFIPTEYMRGRWFIRKINHDVPLERFLAASQSLTVRDTLSSRTQKSPR